MKRNEIISEHKKGYRAKKYNTKYIDPTKKSDTLIEPAKPAKKQGVAEGGKWRKHPDAYDVDDEGNKTPRNPNSSKFGYDPLQRRADTANDAKTPRGKTAALKTSLKMAKGQKGVAEGLLAEMDKSAPQPGRDGRVSHSTYGSRDKGGSKGPEKETKPITAKKAKQDALDILKKQGVAEGRFGRSSYYNPMDYERDQQRQMDMDKREFKRQELQHELGHEDDPDFERKLRQQQMDRDRGPWYIKIDGKIYKQRGEPKMFDWKRGANNYALAILKNKPELQGKIMLTKKLADDETTEATGDPVGKITKVDQASGKATISKPDGTTTEVDPSSLKKTPDGKLQMDSPDQDELTNKDVVSTEDRTREDMMVAPNDSQSPIPGDNDHDEVSKLLVQRLRKLAGL